MLIKHLRNGISVKSNTKRFAEFTNCNLSQRLFELNLLLFNDVEEHQFPSFHILPQSGEKIFLCSHLSFTAAYSLKSEEDWPVDFAKL